MGKLQVSLFQVQGKLKVFGGPLYQDKDFPCLAYPRVFFSHEFVRFFFSNLSLTSSGRVV